MTDAAYTTSRGGVRIWNDFRDNIIIDRYDPVFSLMRARKLKHLHSENSEDAVTWNVFRSLRQIDPLCWLPSLETEALFSYAPSLDRGNVSVNLWVNVSPPPGLRVEADEGVSEIDVVIESPRWVWFIEAKYLSDISTGTTTRPLRDQVLRNIDVGSYYAGVRDFYFSLLIRDKAYSPLGVEAIARYSDLRRTRSLLAAHRPDGLTNLKAVTILTWEGLGEALHKASGTAQRPDERGYAERALAWLRDKAVLGDSA
jgi:hypothetical protein